MPRVCLVMRLIDCYLSVARVGAWVESPRKGKKKRRSREESSESKTSPPSPVLFGRTSIERTTMPLEGGFEPANPVHEQRGSSAHHGAPGSPQTSGCLMGHIGARAPEPVCPLRRMAYGALAARGKGDDRWEPPARLTIIIVIKDARPPPREDEGGRLGWLGRLRCSPLILPR